jgi:hypothetical protein
LSIHKAIDTFGVSWVDLSDLPFILIHRKGDFMQYLLFGGLVAVLGLLWAILALHDDPLEEGIKQAQAWSKGQSRLRKVMSK